MGVSLINLNCGRRGLSSAPTAIQQSADSQHAGHSTLDQEHKRGLVLEHRVAVRPRYPLVGKFLAEQSVESFKDSDQQRDSSQFVLSQQAFTVFLQSVIPSA